MKKKQVVSIFFLIFIGAVIFEFTSNDTESPGDYVALGNQMGIKGDHDGASIVFKNAIKVDPYYIPAYLGLGIAYGNLGRNKDAIEVLKEGIKLDRSYKFSPQMQMGIAEIAFNKMNDKEMALKYAKKALQGFTDQGDYNGVAMTAHKLKQIAPSS